MRTSGLIAFTSLVALSTATIPAINVEREIPQKRAGVMKPIHIRDLEAAITGIERRATTNQTVDFANLTPQQQAQLIYGTPGANGAIILANMTLLAPDGQPIVMMENLDGLTSAVDCKGDDGQLSVTFSSQAAYNKALSTWSYLNNDTNAKFLMITNHEGCGAADQRAIYEINSVRDNSTGLTTDLEAKKVPWKSVTGNYAMDFGKAIVPAQNKLEARGLFGNIIGGVTSAFGDATSAVVGAATSVASDVQSVATSVATQAESAVSQVTSDVASVATSVASQAESVATSVASKVTSAAGTVASDAASEFQKLGNADLDKSVEFNLDAGTPNQSKTIFKDPTVVPPRLAMECTNCFMQGKLKAGGTLNVSDFKVSELSISLSPEDFQTTMDIDTVINLQRNSPFNPKTKASPFKEDLELLTVPVPGAGIEVPEIFTLGLVGVVDAGFEMTLKGAIGFTLGMTATLPNSANIFLDLANPENSHADGFDQATLTPTANVNNGSITLDGAIFVRPKFALEAKVEAVGELSASIGVNLPRINANMSMAFNENGACPGQSDSKEAVLFKWGPAISITAGIDGTLKGFAARVFQRTLATFNFDQHSDCFPVDLPFLGNDIAVPTTTAVAPGVAPTTLPPSTASATASNAPIPSGVNLTANLTSRDLGARGAVKLPVYRRW